MPKRLLVAVLFLAIPLFVFAADETVDLKKIEEKAGPILDNIMAGVNAGDYDKAARDFGEKMAEAENRAGFEKAYEEKIKPILGQFQEKTFQEIRFRDEFVVVLYEGKFEKEDKVAITVVFGRDDPSFKVRGIWFDSEKLRAAMK